MKSLIFALLCLPLFIGCTTFSPQTRALLDSRSSDESVILDSLTFVEGKDGDCGPASLAIVLSSNGMDETLSELRKEVLDPNHNGTLPSQLIVALRSRGLMAVNVKTISDIVQELKAGLPVLVLQNLGFSWAPKWHFAVVIGYDLKEQELVLYSAKDKNLRMPMTYFERHWELADYWGIVAFGSDQLSSTADELEHMKAASGLEALGKLSAAQTAYQSILKRWPRSLTAYLGLGNIAFTQQKYPESIKFLKKGLELDPDSLAIKHNLKIVQAHLDK